jgi:hypothetical protein
MKVEDAAGHIEGWNRVPGFLYNYLSYRSDVIGLLALTVFIEELCLLHYPFGGYIKVQQASRD